LEKARLICELNEKAKGDKGDTARVIRRLAEAYELAGRVGEGAALKEQAEQIRKEIQGSLFDGLPDSEDSYDLLVWFGYR
jgi:hypothetical protein